MSLRLRRLALSVLMSLALPGLSGGAAPARAAELVVGVRADARPFSFRASAPVFADPAAGGPLRAAGYDGYMVRVCDGVLAEMRRSQGFEVVPRLVDAASRFELLRAGEIDILCDPATITRARLDEHLASGPIYLSGITFASRPSVPRNPCRTLVGFVASTTAEAEGLGAVLRAGEWPAFRDILIHFANNDEAWRSAEPACPQQEGRAQPLRAFPTHDALAEAFCNDEVIYYVGDIEIVTAVLGAQPDCRWRDALDTYTDDRYAIFLRGRDVAPEKAALLLEFLGTLSRRTLLRPSLLDEAFAGTFPGYRPSRKLSLFFWSLRGRE
ncbi:transporter substrate-binding domain-containing protein [Oceanicella sp. SM1341]|uniref:transporter substrate-binding domain-containing protein n=1 Tax=Oceanicella sp. SM1341 TaxID=1548889 RepID=UPI000E49D590|nr:transporter substrate-binding domain-containing protein [Oceanicella sp. SM1341]